MPGKGSILIVDDEPIFRKFLANAVSRKYPEASISEAGDGTTALRRLGQDVFDLVVLDVNMPVRDGFDVLKAIRSHEDISAVPVIMCTGTNDEDEVRRLIVMGVSGYIVKSRETSVMTNKLFRLIDALLAEKSPVFKQQQQKLYGKKVSLLNSVLVIADENHKFRKDLQMLLSPRYTVLTCENIKEVFIICRKVKPGVLLLGRTADTQNSHVAQPRLRELASRLHMTVVRMLPNRNMLRMFNDSANSPVEIGIVRTMNAEMVVQQVKEHVTMPEYLFQYKDGTLLLRMFHQTLLSDAQLSAIMRNVEQSDSTLVHTVCFDTSQWDPDSTVAGEQVSMLMHLAETAASNVENVQIIGTDFKEESPLAEYSVCQG